jgi:hypothetical protein
MIGYSFILLAYILANYSSKYAILAAFLGGVWAMLPDLVWIQAIPKKYVPILMSFHDSSYADLCFFHKFIDGYYPYDLPDDVIIYVLLGLILTTIYSTRMLQRRTSGTIWGLIIHRD